jgi:hypothetical protein
VTGDAVQKGLTGSVVQEGDWRLVYRRDLVEGRLEVVCRRRDIEVMGQQDVVCRRDDRRWRVGGYVGRNKWCTRGLDIGGVEQEGL